MLNAFHISASSMQAHQNHVDVIANNLANVNTPGFKKSKVEFKDLMYVELASAQGLPVNPDIDDAMGMGTGTAAIEKVFSQGETKATDRDLDMAIQGKGFFELLMPDGDYAYTRTGNLQIDRDGMLVNTDGYPLSPAIQVPIDAQNLLITPEGSVKVQLPGEAALVEIGQIELADFMNPSGLSPLGDNLYRPSSESGNAFYNDPGEGGLGSLQQGYLEGSNVNMIEELTNMMLAQRGYEMNAKVIQAADDMLGIINNLRR